jgi:cystathionine beta-synthase
MGLALVAIIKGYKLICVISDKSKEKMDILHVLASAKVVVCPTTDVRLQSDVLGFKTAERLN